MSTKKRYQLIDEPIDRITPKAKRLGSYFVYIFGSIWLFIEPASFFLQQESGIVSRMGWGDPHHQSFQRHLIRLINEFDPNDRIRGEQKIAFRIIWWYHERARTLHLYEWRKGFNRTAFFERSWKIRYSSFN